MARRPIQLRIDEVIEAALAVFSAKGYVRARLEDVAAVLEVSAPALYNYVQGKDALFELVVRRATFPTVDLDVREFPVPNPAPGDTLAFIAAFARQRAELPALTAALSKRKPKDTAGELREILGEFFDTMAFFRRGIRLVEKCAEEWPALRSAWFAGGRQQYHESFGQYCALRQKSGALWDGIPPAHAAKLMIETCAMFAIHRHYDPQPAAMSMEEARRTAVESMVQCFAGGQVKK